MKNKQKQEELLTPLRKLVNSVNKVRDVQDLIQCMGHFADLFDRVYYNQEDKDIDYEKPARLIHLDEGSELVIKHGEICRKEEERDYYGIYSKNNKKFLIYIGCTLNYSKNPADHKKQVKAAMNNVVLKKMGYKFCEMVTLVNYQYYPVSNKYLPKNKKEKNTTMSAFRRFTDFGKLIWDKKNSTKKIPAVALSYSAPAWSRQSLKDDWSVTCSGDSTFSMPRSPEVVEDKSNHMKKFALYKVENKLIRLKKEVKTEFGVIGGRHEPFDQMVLFYNVPKKVINVMFSHDYGLKGNFKRNKESKDHKKQYLK